MVETLVAGLAFGHEIRFGAERNIGGPALPRLLPILGIAIRVVGEN